MIWLLFDQGKRIAEFDTEDEAMRAAQDRGLVRRADEDEGGSKYGVLVDTASIVPVFSINENKTKET